MSLEAGWSKGNSACDSQPVHRTPSKLCSKWHLILTTTLPVCYLDEETKTEKAESFWLYQPREWRTQDADLADWCKSLGGQTSTRCSFWGTVRPVKKCAALWRRALPSWGNSPCWKDSYRLLQAQHGEKKSIKKHSSAFFQWLTGHQGRGALCL